MFSQFINSPISPLTEDYFGDYLARPRREFDYVLSCLGFVLFMKRIKDYKGICGNFQSIQGAYIPGMVRETLLLRKNAQEKNTTPAFYYNVTSTPMNDAMLEETRQAVISDGGVELEQVEMYIKQETKVPGFYVFVHAETNTVIIISPSTSMTLYHLCLAFVYAYYPAVFQNAPLTEQEVQLLKTLTVNTVAKFMAAMTAALDPLKREIVEKQLLKCFRGFRQKKIRAAETEVENARNRVVQFLDQYRSAMRILEEQIIVLEGMKVVNGDGTNDQEQELIEYLSGHENIDKISYSDGYLTYYVKTQLTNFDRMKWKNAVTGHDIFNSYRLEPDNPFSALAARKMLLTALFDTDDPELTINIMGLIRLEPNRNWMEVVSGDVSCEGMENYIANPHYKYHGCPGRNRDQIISCLSRGDLVAAIECSVAATGSVNIGETEYTFRRMVQEVLSSNRKIIHRYDGVDLTPAEALLWLASRQKGEDVA